jgi:hypothetical protein
VAGLDEATRAALDAAEAQRDDDETPPLDDVVSLSGRRR